MMDPQHALDWEPLAIGLLAILAAVFGWFMRSMVADQREIEKSLASFRESVPKEYVSKDDNERRWDQLMTVLTRIESKLDGKADKP